MKVTAIETHICHCYRTNWVFVKVLTDSGLYGVGEATLEHRERTVEAAVKELERYLVGRDPHDVEAFWHEAYRLRNLRHYTGALTQIRPADARSYFKEA